MKKFKNIFKRIKCLLGYHDNYDWHPYPKIYPECTVKRCKICDYYYWRERP